MFPEHPADHQSDPDLPLCQPSGPEDQQSPCSFCLSWIRTVTPFPGSPSLLRPPLYTSALEIFLKCTFHHAGHSRSLYASQEPSGHKPRSFRWTDGLSGAPAWPRPFAPLLKQNAPIRPDPAGSFMRRAFPAPPSGPTPSPHLPRELAFIFKVTLSDRHPLFARSPDPASPCPMRGDNCLLPPRQSCSSASPRACAAPLIAHSNDLVAPQASPPLERAFLEGSEWPPHG